MDIIPIVRVACALFCSIAALPAQTLNVTLTAVNPSQTASGSFNGGSTYANYRAGVLVFDISDAFCSDPNQPISLNETVIYSIRPMSALPNSSSISKVMGGYLASSKTALDAAGAQWAIWEIIGDGINSPSLSSGSIRLAGSGNTAIAVANRAQDYLNNLSSFPSATFIYGTNPTRQDMVFMVPETSGALLGALGALSLLVRRRR